MNRVERLLPPGVKDIFGEPARHLTRLNQALSACFERWGYEPVIPPTFEYFDNLMRGFDETFSREMYRFVDPQGHLVALRPDLTVPVARLVATKLYDQPMPLRFFYTAPVFRYVEPRAGRQREFWQAGAELIGANTPEADAEIIALHVATLEASGLSTFQVNLGHMGFLHGILAHLDELPPNMGAIRRAIDRKNRRILAQELEQAGLKGPVRAALEELPVLWGGVEVLERAAQLAPNGQAKAAIERLRAVHALLHAYGVAERVTLDLGEVRGMNYYTGITFETFAPGSGYAIASGGRYDTLLERYGAPLPAVGFAVQVEQVLFILEREQALPSEPPADALMVFCGHAACLADLRARRARGERVLLDVRRRPPEEVAEEAVRRGIPAVLVCGQRQEVARG